MDIDSIAGPSEVVVIVDRSTRPDFTAADLIAQAEHAPGASILIGWDEAVLDAAVAELGRPVGRLGARRAGPAEPGRVRGRDSGPRCRRGLRAWPTRSPPSICTSPRKTPSELAEKIRHAGAMFLGNYTPVALGDYAAGPSHVLPTSGTARFASGLSANDFLRASSILHFSRAGPG